MSEQQILLSTYDVGTGAIYIYVQGSPLSDAISTETIAVEADVALDYDSDGALMGVEILLPT